MGKRDVRRGSDAGSARSRRFVRALPALMICAGVAFDLLTPAVVTAVPLFAAAPLIAAPFFSLASTVRVGVASILVVLGIRISDGALGRVVPVTDLLTLVTVTALSLVINRVVRRRNEQLASARVIAETAMRAVLPTPEDRIGGLLVAARYEAAQADEFVGGDLYAVADTPFGVRLVLGDVRGKGLDAVAAVAVVIGAFREAAEQELSLEGVVQRLERALAREGSRRGGFDSMEGFVTAVLAEIPSGSDTLRVVNRGHPEPLVLHQDGALDVLSPTVPALPLGMGLGAWPDRSDEWTLPAGSMFLAFTDGLSEARDAKGAFYDPAARLRGRIFPGPDELLSALTDDVRLHTGGRSTDDLALLAVGRPARGQQERRTTVKIVGRDSG
ncbi:PP2C family protein-serine/threonine phosphatase [Streptomyces sp. NE06-03E]|uniref:PP2C family protein-serine/threonine phosphatase n=1 Tax=Streptomyces silvae TaxID=2803812 RepID=A0ABU8A6E9_9ACTN|nr:MULTISPECIES: PP2C family protein-serine/threonine phosphatase [unclassified Streptomyces]WSS63245.1 serine/threonine-protein phosphatase [Streptomyces sp. NBC_01177]WSS70240.1 serine/threonine-protein phosphatase [Streptomyces sp. NBC_01175]WSS77242.1 serine/threonine-protein phosphatase [Streptomyces sp. NBC_01174]MDX3059684.1 PP2C family protein-serine/threonine phosphatase [Streptomyces sp. NE06-03E]MDX3329197.1 PP2C family protein-serine/threonine phosphatase [Streptomyces sp. ME02-697